MPAGSGPQVNTVQAGSITASEIAVLTSVAAAFNNSRADQGNLISASVSYTASAAQTLTLRIRQGNGTGGVLVGVAQAFTIAAAGTYPIAAQVQDLSAFALGPTPAGQYTLTLQSSIAGPGTVVYALLEVETAAPVI